MTYYDIVLIVLLFISAVLLFLLAEHSQKYVSVKWRVCYLIPVIITLMFTAFAGFDIHMLGAYIASLLFLGGLIKETKAVRRICSVLGAVSIIITIPVCLSSVQYRAYDYVADFNTGFDSMKSHYALGEHKDIDWDGLYKEYLPKFEAVNRSQDKIENLIVWTEFTSEFNDGHVAYMPDGDYTADLEKAYDRVLGNDYGLALMTLSDGRTVAVNVADSGAVYDAGIRNGTEIIKWDGAAPENISDDALRYISFSDKDNKEFYRALFCSGTGGESIAVTFLDENGTEKAATLPKLGAFYSGRLKDALAVIDGGIEAGNMEWVDIDEKTAALRVKMMIFDSNSTESGDFRILKNQLIEKLDELKAQGKEHIILDLRSNGGGSGGMVKAIASVFAPVGSHYYCTDASWNELKGEYEKDGNGNYIPSTENYFEGEGLWNGKITILVNVGSVSAADHLVSVMQGMENVTIMGFTESNGSAQGIGGLFFNNLASLSFSSSLLLDKDGNVFIDSGTSMESGNGIDITVPFDDKAVIALFEKGEDYLLNKALGK